MAKVLAALLVLAAIALVVLLLAPIATPLHGRPEVAAGAGGLFVAGVLLLGRRAEGPFAAREAVLVLTAGGAASFTLAVLVGVARGWEAATLAALALGALGEGLVAVGLAARLAMREERHRALFIPGVLLTAAVGLVQLLVLTLGAA